MGEFNEHKTKTSTTTKRWKLCKKMREMFVVYKHKLLFDDRINTVFNSKKGISTLTHPL